MIEFGKTFLFYLVVTATVSLVPSPTSAEASSLVATANTSPLSTYESEPSSYYRGQRQVLGYGGYGGYQQPYYSGSYYQRPYNNYNQGYSGYSGYNNYNNGWYPGYQSGYYNSYSRPYYNNYYSGGGGGYGGGGGVFPQPVRGGYF